MMRTSPRGIEDLVLSEGIRLTAYKDSVGVYTIGVGHAATSGRAPIPKAGMRITRQQAFDILAKDLAEAYEPAVRKALGNVPQHVFDGAVSFHFNTGAIARASWVKRYKAGDMPGARRAFMQWNKPPEIIGRRTREAELIFDGKYRSKPAGSVVDVRWYQEALDRLWFYDGPIDGIHGRQTTDAVKAFQKSRGLVVDGIVGPATKAALLAALVPPAPQPDDPGPTVSKDETVRFPVESASDTLKRVQARLIELGYYEVGNVDGLMGSRTRGALLAFKADNGLPLNDKIDAATEAALKKAKPREVSPERANADEKTVADHAAIKDSNKVGLVAKAGGAVAVVGGLADTGILDKAEQIVGFGGRIKWMLSEVWDVVGPFWWVALLVAAVAVFLWVRGIKKEEVESYRVGETP